MIDKEYRKRFLISFFKVLKLGHGYAIERVKFNGENRGFLLT